jgi:putative ABC transport system substrate-binding protein
LAILGSRCGGTESFGAGSPAEEIAPGVTRAALLRDSSIAIGPAQFAAIQTVVPSMGVELRPVDVRDEGEIERAIAYSRRALIAA